MLPDQCDWNGGTILPERCEHCNSELFRVVPFKTTQQEITEFAQRSSLPDGEKEVIITDRWMHPGRYCPRGCVVIFLDGPLKLPDMTVSEAIRIGKEYSQKHHQEFVETHGVTSRIVACVHCVNFKGAVVEDWHNTHLYYNPKYRPLCNHKVAQASCRVPLIQRLRRAWWYDKGKNQPECKFFEYDKRLFVHIYKDVTGWSEYPDAAKGKTRRVG